MDSFFSEYPHLLVKVKVTSCKSLDEHFSLQLNSNAAQINASSPIAKRYALSQLKAALESKRPGEFVGEIAPLFTIRPLWLQEGESFRLASGLVIFLPFFVLQPALEDKINEIIDMGYNTLIFASNQKDAKNMDIEHMRPIFDQIRNSGLKIAMSCSGQFDDDVLFQKMAFLNEICDYIFWYQDTIAFTAKKDPTPFERAQAELELLQNKCPLPLFYYTKPSISYLLQLKSTNALILFDAQLAFFTDIARECSVDQLKLLPMIDISQLEHSEGSLFSDVPFEYIENILGRQRLKRFVGAGCYTLKLPNTGSYAQMPLWIVGQRMWRALSVYALFDVWLDRYHPEWHCWLSSELVKVIHMLFCHKKDGNFEEAGSAMQRLSQILIGYKIKLRFQKSTKSLEELSLQLLHLQQVFKSHFEASGTKAMIKIPLSIQNFTPFAFNPCL